MLAWKTVEGFFNLFNMVFCVTAVSSLSNGQKPLVTVRHRRGLACQILQRKYCLLVLVSRQMLHLSQIVVSCQTIEDLVLNSRL